jgi:hypothetical protein
MTKNKNRQWILNVRPAGRLTGGRVSLERDMYSTALRWTGAGPELVVVGRSRAAHLDDA